MSKKSDDTYEPIKLDTTILKIDIKTNGDLITKEYDLIPFHPNMSDMKDLSNNNYILFPSFVKITMDYLKNAGVGQDYRKVFTDLEKYIKLIRYVTKPEKEVDEDFTLLVDQTQYKNYAMSFVQDFTTDITFDFRPVQKYEPLTSEEIITNNIGLIKSIFLPINGRFFVLGHEYIINECKYIPPYIASTEVNEKISSDRRPIPLNYTIKVEMQLLDAALNPNVGDFSKLTCKAKKLTLNKDVKEVFGESFGYKEDIKAILPPLTPTTTSKRGFGKLQLDWEKRNKYVKAALTEKERLAQEKEWSPLQKKMAQFEKYQEEYNKIPPLWIKERKDLEDKYTAFEKEMERYRKEISTIIEANKDKDNAEQPSFVKDLIKAVEDKMREATRQLKPTDKTYVPEKESDKERDERLKKEQEDIDAFIKYVSELKEPYINSNEVKTKIINDWLVFDKKVIDNKYTEPFLVDLRSKEKDVNELEKENKKISEELKKMDPSDYDRNAKLQELSKVQAILLKKKTDYQALVAKFGENGETLVKDKWEIALKGMEDFKKNIEMDKSIGEKTILNESVTKELAAKLKEIKLLKDKLIKANYFAGEYAELLKKEITEFSKKPGDKPIEDVELLKSNIRELEEEYLVIAKKLGLENQLQGYITLLNDDLERIKKLKDGKEEELSTKNKEDQKINADLKNIADANARKTVAEQEEAAKSKKDEQKLLQDKISNLTKIKNIFLDYDKAFNGAILSLKKLNLKDNSLKSDTINDSTKNINGIKKKFLDQLTNKDSHFDFAAEGGSTIKKRTTKKKGKNGNGRKFNKVKKWTKKKGNKYSLRKKNKRSLRRHKQIKKKRYTH